MRYFRTKMRSRRLLLAGAVVAAVVLGGSAIAYAAYPTSSVAVMTGCLTTSGTGSGNIVNVAMGTNPFKTCASNQKQIQLSGGTITQVTAGTGLTTAGSGGTDIGGSANSINNGFATLGLQSSYALPQGCTANQVPDWGGTTNTWGCADNHSYSGADFALSNQSCDTGQFLTGFDTSGVKKCAADQTYSNGDGLDLSGNTFSLKSGFQLPQTCSSGQVVTSNGSNGWTCSSNSGTPEGVSDLTDYIRTDYVNLGDDDTGTTHVFCNSGDIATGGGWSVSNDANIIEAGPDNDNGYEGWSAKGSTPTGAGFDYGTVVVYVKCLKTLQ